ncbi:hypothetical protein FRZ67_18885 [Panacibacter ginsenosidivorans]|uniref:Uncharacterized protein n=1 Tax=Panacibacter ginsenosidivorans TaxID=1813871 RepID=A0A5B8VCU0_9BACT|nr:hypothetical protein [Panacibacter ginsenosidivorans]QEC69274.1 hypothetical protein FRZ67_18885 [Panacibacter ginsenosidivorans]
MKKSKAYNRAVQARQKLAGKWLLVINKIKKRCAQWLDRKINPLPVAKKRRLLYVFCAVCVLYSTWLLLSPFRASQDVAIKIEPVHLPVQKTDEKHPQANALIPVELYSRIHRFKLYLDSLAKDSTGQKQYDSIVKTHPGIKDSLQKVEDYYQLQK